MGEVSIIGLSELPEVSPGEDLGQLLVKAARSQSVRINHGDVVVITSKIVSKAEGRIVRIREVEPSTLAKRVSRLLKKDPRVVEMIFSESRRIVRMVKGLLLTETRHGLVCANAGVDQSNIEAGYAALLPLDPDASAGRIRATIRSALGVDVAVIITDTFGRAWREGQTDVAIGLSGMIPLRDYRGQRDAHGYHLKVTVTAVADEIASAAELVMGKVDRVPIAVVKGYTYPKGEGSSRALIRPPSRDLFR